VKKEVFCMAENLTKTQKRITITLTPNMTKLLEREAKKKGISKSALISIAIEKYSRDEKAEK